MFDIGFSEILVIAVVALIVIGPERLPRVARTLGHLFGRLQRYVNDVKADISREIELDELRRAKSEFEQAAQSVQTGLESGIAQVEADANSIAGDLRALDGSDASPPAPPVTFSETAAAESPAAQKPAA